MFRLSNVLSEISVQIYTWGKAMHTPHVVYKCVTWDKLFMLCCR